MELTKEYLDKRICDVEEGANNTETFREFIINTEQEFDLISKDLDGMNDKQLNEYLEFLDYIWDK